ncbi:MAG: M16 family metallopeptidase [Candidatus Marinarcus sp.]|uniref:M16 family metallopeptidase n=1 Tax=Candidatus Marinarcus sp. TaxID=3100987 RepID=UPI003B00C55F
MSATIQHIAINDTTSIPIIFEQDNSLPTFNLQLVFKNSGYMQDKKQSGIANISAKLLNEGTKELGSIKFADKLESKAISLETSNGFETFVIELSCLKSESKTALKLLEKLLKSPNFTQNTLDKIKTTQMGILKRKENDFDYIAQNNLKKLIFKGTPLENSSNGTIQSISTIKLKDVKNFIHNAITLNNLIVVAGGDFSFTELEKSIHDILLSIPNGNENTLQIIQAQEKPSVHEEIKDTQQAYIYFGSPYHLEAQNKKNYIAKVASFILGGSGFGSRLMEEIRVKRGLAYSAYGSISINKSHTYFTGYLQTKLESATEAKELVKSLIEEFVKNGVTQKELDSAKKFLSGSEPLRTETLSQRLNRAFTYYYRGLDPDFAQQELNNIEKLSLDELNAFIKSHNEIQNLSFSIVRK